MERKKAALGSAAFFMIAPGGATGLIPWLPTRWQVEQRLPFWLPLRITGAVALLAAVAVLTSSFARFVAKDFGTPTPVAPPDHLVVGGGSTDTSVATRYDKVAARYQSTVHIAAIDIWLRHL
ncbi:hypothetical protein [Saccharothrix deserti]|uniref:hypothetical protein n=1 Tax=Saccharothrix deserti TaxID=2593674 RepID=UPI00131B85C9|nr:hypothetical protein [Saccharothrix deserti]